MDTEPTEHDLKAAELIKAEVDRQIAMWGNAAEHARNPVYMRGQMLHAAAAYCSAVIEQDTTGTFPAFPPLVWPPNWGGFRDYGTSVATLAVVGAFIQNEIARRLHNGEPSDRRPRSEVDMPILATPPAPAA